MSIVAGIKTRLDAVTMIVQGNSGMPHRKPAKKDVAAVRQSCEEDLSNYIIACE